MRDKPLHDVTHADIQALVDAGVGESRTLEFKEQLPPGSDRGMVEFCKDVTAMANAQGGDIVFGVSEQRDDAGRPTGRPAAIIGLGGANLDAEQLRLTNLLRDGVDPILFGVEFKVVGHETKPLLVVRIARSLTAPHMVTVRDNRRFYVRTGTGTAPMDIDELRASFLGGQAFEQRVDAFRRMRLMRLLAGEAPVANIESHLIVLHFVPLSSQVRVDVARDDLQRTLQPLEGGGGDARHNIDGFVTFRLGRGSYSQLFRNGAVECATPHGFNEDRKGRHFIAAQAIPALLVGGCRMYLRVAESLAIRPPYAVAVAILGAKGRYLHFGESFPEWGEPSVATDDALVIPDVVLNEVPVDPGRVLRPVLDMIWQAFGHPACNYYDKDGALNRAVLAR